MPEFKVVQGPVFRNAISSVDVEKIQIDLQEMGYHTSGILKKSGLYTAAPVAVIPTTNSCIEIYGEHINFCACDSRVCSDVEYGNVKDSLTDSENDMVRYLKRSFRLPRHVTADRLLIAGFIGIVIAMPTLGALGYL